MTVVMTRGRAIEPGPDDVERWLPVPGWPAYDVSDWGRVRSFKRNGGHWSLRVGQTCSLVSEPRIVKGQINKYGYTKIVLSRKNGRFKKNLSVHALVLEAFSEPRPANYQGCHNDGNPLNNRLDNLRWDTQSANQIDRIRHGPSKKSRLTESAIPEIWRRLVDGDGPAAIGRDFGVSFDVIAAIRASRSWTHITRTLPGRPAHELGAVLTDFSIRPDPLLANSPVEMWRALRDWPAYRISSFGRVESCYLQSGGGWVLGEQWWPRKTGANGRRSGHFTFLAKNGIVRAKTLFVHQMVLASFVCPRPPGMVACHNDGDPSNNHLGNLRWDTRRANALDRFRHARERAAVAS